MTEREKMKECLIKHYTEMSKSRALKLMDSLNKTQKAAFKRKINHCKKYNFID
jgi:hypothetical protein